MTSISKTSRNCLLKLDDCSSFNSSDYIVTESFEQTEDESDNSSFISALDKSELDIELEICEKMLALDDNEDVNAPINNLDEESFENNELEIDLDAFEAVIDNLPGVCIDDSYQQGSKNNELECVVKVGESPYESNAETCINKPTVQLCGNIKFENDSVVSFCESPSENKKTDYNSHDLPSSSNVSEDEFDSDVKMCRDILKSEEPSDSDDSYHRSQILQPMHFNEKTDSYAISIMMNREIKSEKLETPIPVEIVKSEKISSPIPTESIVKSENIGSPNLERCVVKAENVELPIPEETVVKSENIESLIPVECVVKSEIINSQTCFDKTAEVNCKKRCKESSDSDALIIVYESNKMKPKKIKVQKVIPQVKIEKDEDELSLFAETDNSSTVEEYEVLESADYPQNFKESSDEEQNKDLGTKRVLSSVVVVPQKNYLDEEREDINDSGWESMKNLSTEEERYKLVRKCWKSSKVPDPNRNLTYHSYRKRHLKNLSVLPKTRKRKATSNLDFSKLNPSKRQRSCTFMYDINIDYLSEEKYKKQTDINNEMQSKVDQLNDIYFQQEQRLQREYYETRNNNAYGQMWNLRDKFQREIENVRHQYHSMASQLNGQLENGINKLNKARNEVLQFFQFYKGLNSEDPTVLTASQLQELEEIENIYLHFDKLYQPC